MMPLAELKEYISYDKDTGVFTWLKPTYRQTNLVGKEVGNICSGGYREASIKGTRIRLHRLAWYFEYGELPEKHIDHINHDRLDNRICNLRKADDVVNQRNTNVPKNNKSGTIGVYKSKRSGRWKANICVNYKTIALGTFVRLEDAIVARKAAEVKYGFHVNHGKEEIND